MQKQSRSNSACSAFGCTNNQNNCTSSFFRFPKDIERAKLWAIACGREDLLEKDDLYTSYRLCGAHFENYMFLNDLKNRLQQNVIPSLFPQLENSSTAHHKQPSKVDSFSSCTSILQTSAYLVKDKMPPLMITEENPAISSETLRPDAEKQTDFEEGGETVVAKRPRIVEGFSDITLTSPSDEGGEQQIVQGISINSPPTLTTGRSTVIDFSDRCRTCLEQRSPQTTLIFTNITKHCYVGKTFKQVIIMLVPDTSETLHDDDLVCENCAETLKRSVALIQRCLVIEENLKKCQLFPDIKITLHSTDKTRKDVSEAKHPNNSIHSNNRSCLYTNDTNDLENNSQYINIPNIILYPDMIDDTNELENVDQYPYVPNIILDTGTSHNYIDLTCVENFSTSEIDNTATEAHHDNREGEHVEGDHEYCEKLEYADQNLDENLICLLNGMEKHDRIISLEPVDHAATVKCITSLNLHGINIRDASTNDEDNNFKRKRILLIGADDPTHCPDCKKSLIYHRDHVCRKKNRKTVPPKPSEKCTKCGKNIHAGFMDYHLKKHERDERKKQEYEKLKEAKKLASLKCGTCDVKFTSKEEFDFHLELHPPYVCEQCGKGFVKKESLGAHKATHNDPNTYICEVCGKGCKDVGILRNHLNSHANNTYKCTLCPKVFKQKAKVNLHIKRVHHKIFNVQCTLCGKLFTTASSHDSHVRVVHYKEKPYECNICQRKFGRMDYLQNHKSRHTGEYRVPRKIKSGEPTVRRRRKIRYIIENTVEPVPCKFCGIWFKDMIRLRRHLETHVKRYRCQFCPLTFSRKAICQRHEKSHEGGKVVFYRCDVCWKRFKSKAVLDEHVKCHDKPRYSCDLCGKPFNRIFLLNHHKLIEHDNIPNAEQAEEIIFDSLMEVSGGDTIKLLD